MIVKCWGARGSIPVSGQDYLKYGGDTTCLEIRTKDDEIIIVDAGSGIRRLGSKLLAEKRNHYHLIFTHAHWDHILGFPFFKPIYFDKILIDLYGCPFAQEKIEGFIRKTMGAPHFPVNYDDINAKTNSHGICRESFSIGTLQIIPTLLNHPNQGIGYKFVEDGKSFVFLTDNELTFKHPGGLDYQDYVEFSKNADLLFHDSEYTEQEYKITKGWGHSVYRDVLQLALESRVKRFGLFHHNQERSDRVLDEIVGDCLKIVRDSKSDLECFAVQQDMEITV